LKGKILVLPKSTFDDVMQNHGIIDENVENEPFAFISIESGTSGNHYFKNNHANVLNLNFDDIGPDIKLSYPNLTLFSDEQAKEIIRFWKANKGKKFIIHCTAGISRSGAVGNFIRQVEEIDYEDFIQDNPNLLPNGWVLKVLNDVYQNSFS